MVLMNAAGYSTRKVDNWMLGRADLRLIFCSGIYCSLPTDCGYMCAHLGLIVMIVMVMMAMVRMAMVMMAMVMMAMVMMAMVMMAMMMVWVMVIIVLEALRQVGCLRHH
jgi:hypothetical protein